VFGGMVRCVVDGGVSCCWLAVNVNLYFGRVSEIVSSRNLIVLFCLCVGVNFREGCMLLMWSLIASEDIFLVSYIINMSSMYLV
jgi:hypothetical protein